MSEARITDFYRLEPADRIRALVERGLISTADARSLLETGPLLSTAAADKMIENVIGVFGLPLAVVPDFLVNGKTFLVPMVVEEPSIVAGVSSVAKLAWGLGGFQVTSTESLLIGQIQMVGFADADLIIRSLQASQDEILALANEKQPRLKARGGGAQALEYFKYQLADGRWTVVLHLLVDTCDAMGANVVNTMCEDLAPEIERLSGAKVVLKILSNLADRALVTATVSLPVQSLARGEKSGEAIRDSIILANDFANADPYRAATHNKGIMNGIDAVALATGNDWRSIEAGAHAYAARDGAYRALTAWSATTDGELRGTLRIPMKVGVVGGSQSSNAAAAIGLRIAAADSARELAELMAAVGLAQNLAALRALVSDGIQKGHMSLHARSVAAAAGTSSENFDQVVAGLLESGEVKQWKAAELIESLREPVERDVAAKDIAQGEASGKVILLGEHAVVYDKRALALPLPSGVVARIAENNSATRLAVPDWGFDQKIESNGKSHGGVAAILSLIVQYFGVADRGFDIRVRSRIPAGMGLGSSAALAVAIIRAFDQLTRTGMSDVDVDALAFECEKISHGTPSGIDNYVATYGRPVLFRKGASDGTQALQIAAMPPLVIATCGVRGNTLQQVAGVRARYDKNPELYSNIFNEIDEISAAGASALARSDYEELGVLMNVCQGFLNAIGVSTAELEKMISIARKSGALGAKLSGAGGGGAVVALCPGAVSEVSQALEAAGYRIVGMEDW